MGASEAEAEFRDIRRESRVAGWLYLLMAATAPIGLMVVPNALIVPRDPAATAERIRAAEWMFRLGIASEVFHQALAVFVTFALYRMFKPVDAKLPTLMLMLGTLGVPITILNSVFEFGALLAIRAPDALSAFDARQLDALAYTLLRLHARGLDVATVFWGLWLFPFGRLVIRSGFFPRWLGWSLYVAGAAYVANCFMAILAPPFAGVFLTVAPLLYGLELPIILWLVAVGARPRSA